jgi:signal transduction histidine kinase/ABC-type amino acid transport substrate-binding protein
MVKLLPALPPSYVVGVRRDWSPLTFADGQNQPEGFSVELLQAVAKEVGFTPEFKFYEPSLTSTEALLAGEIDISAAKVAMAAESDEVAQTSPYYLATAAIFTRRSDWSIRTLEDLKTKRVSVLRYSSAHDWAVTHNVNVLVLDAPRAVLASVADGRADACILFRSFALSLVKQLGIENVRPVDVELDGVSAGFCIATRSEDVKLARAIDAALTKLRQAGEVTRLRQKWIDPLEPPPSTWEIPRDVVAACILVIITALGFFAWREALLRRRVQAEKLEAQANQMRFQSAMAGSLDAVFLLDAMRDESGIIRDFRIRDLNERGEQLIQASRAEAIGQRLCEFRPVNRTGGFFEKYVRVVETGEPLEEEFSIDAPPVVATWIYHQVVKVGDGIIITSRNISERKQLESDARQSQKMEAIGQLAGGIVHDFRNLLLAIQGNLELAKRQVGSAHPAQNSLEQIEEAAKQAGNVTQSLLLFTRRAAPNYSRVDLTEVVNRTARLLWRTLPPNIRLEVPGERRPCWVLADETQVQQLLMNLAINGRDAILAKGDTGGVLTIAAYTDREERNIVEVSDTGVGMSQEVINRIFEPYFTTKPRGQGTGLGLSIAHAIVNSIGGSITVDSELGRGTTIRVQLPPAPDPAPPRHEPGATEVENRTGRRIVALVEANGLVRSIMTTMLERMNIDTVGAASAAELAISLLTRQVDAAIVDLDSDQAPDLAEIRRALGPTRPMLVIRPAKFTLDIVDPLHTVLNKPFGAAQLSDALEEAFAMTSDDPSPTNI